MRASLLFVLSLLSLTIMRIIVLADTHIPARAKDLPLTVYQELEHCDAIVHAGDVMCRSLIEKLQHFAPVYAVKGNNDIELDLPIKLEVELEEVTFAIIHDSGAATGRTRRMRRTFPGARVVVFGHSHIPWNSDDGKLLLFNPGSPTDKRRQPCGTMGIIEIVAGTIQAKVVEV